MKPWLKFSLRLLVVWGLMLFLIMTRANSSMVKAAAFNGWPTLKEGALDEEFWELILGKWSDWQIVDGRLQAQLQPPPTISAIIPSTAHWSVSGDYELSFDYLPLDHADKNLAIYFDHGYKSNGSPALDFLSFHFINRQLHVDNYIRGFSSRNAIIPFVMNPGQTYRVKLIYQQPDFILLFDDQEIFSTIENTNFWPNYETGGRPMFYISCGIFEQSVAVFSNFSLKSLSRIDLSYYSQLDSAWANDHYGKSGFNLTPWKSIADWGCALTSAVMLLHYYGYEHFLDGQAINPATLNLWLKAQGDGYLAESLVNWLAISRLTQLLHAAQPELARPILEYRFAHFDERIITEQLEAGQPVIADVGSHFLIISGQREDDYLIVDPQSEAELLSERYGEIKSLRIFEPSQSDLSYFLISSLEPLDFAVKNAISEQELHFLSNHLSFAGQEHYLYYWPKPASASYVLSFTNLEQLASATLFTYQQTGAEQIFPLGEVVEAELVLDYAKNQEASLVSSMLIYQQLYLAYLKKLQTDQHLAGQLENVARYQTLIERFLDFERL